MGRGGERWQGGMGRGGDQAARGTTGTGSGLLDAASLPCWQREGQACLSWWLQLVSAVPLP